MVSPRYFKAFLGNGNARDLKRSHWLPLAEPSWTKGIGPVFNIFKEGDIFSFSLLLPYSAYSPTILSASKLFFLSAIYACFHFLYCLIEESTKIIKIKLNLFWEYERNFNATLELWLLVSKDSCICMCFYHVIPLCNFGCSEIQISAKSLICSFQLKTP